MRCGMEGKVPVFLRVPVEAREFSWGHDRRYDVRLWAARMRKRGTRTKSKTANDQGLVGPSRLPPKI